MIASHRRSWPVAKWLHPLTSKTCAEVEKVSFNCNSRRGARGRKIYRLDASKVRTSHSSSRQWRPLLDRLPIKSKALATRPLRCRSGSCEPLQGPLSAMSFNETSAAHKKFLRYNSDRRFGESSCRRVLGPNKRRNDAIECTPAWITGIHSTGFNQLLIVNNLRHKTVENGKVGQTLSVPSSLTSFKAKSTATFHKGSKGRIHSGIR